MLGLAPVVDFDGTVTTLDVPWGDLRARLGVRRIDELWDNPDDGWAAVARAEEEAASCAEPVATVVDALRGARAVAVLTSNSEAAVWRFLARYEDLRDVVAAVVGRETLGGPKSEYEVFARGFRRCAEATAMARPVGESVVYLGDQPYELRFARRLGARALHVSEIAPR